MNKEKVILSIDLGTTSTRVVAFTKEAKQISQSSYEFKQFFPNPGWVEQDPIEILEATTKALKDVAGEVGTENIISLGITNQRETTILWDKNSGKPIHKAIVWQDRRTEPFCTSIQSHAKEVKDKTGLIIDPYFSASKIHWLYENVSGLKNQIDKGDILFGTPDVWLLWNLTGRKTFAIEPSNASRTLLYNLEKNAFDEDLLKLFSVDSQILPPIKDSDSDFGVLDKNILGKEIPINAILGDQQASLFGHGGWDPGIIKNTYGTGLFVMTSTGSTVQKSEKLLSTVAWKTKKGMTYALEGSIMMGASTIQWLKDNLELLSSTKESEGLARELESNEGVYFVPALQGLGAPHWKPAAKGIITGLTRRTSKAHIARAALESLAYQTDDVVDEFRKHVHQVKELRVDGGASQNDFLMQFQSDLLDVPIQKSRLTEMTAFGVAALSGLSMGLWTEDQLKNLIPIEKAFHPKMTLKKRSEIKEGWKEALTKI